MALTLTYSVTSLKVKDEVNADGDTLTNAVTQTYWKCTGTDENGNTGEFQGATPFTAANVPSDSFTDFADLTEEQVVGWIRAVVEGDAGYKAHIEEQIQRQIDIELEQETEMPWAESVTPETPEPLEEDPIPAGSE